MIDDFLNKIHLGDCMDILRQLPDKSVDLVLTDPPYNTLDCDWDVKIDCDALMHQLLRIVKTNGAVLVFGSEPFASRIRISAIKHYKYDWVWNKTRPANFPLAKKQPLKYHEIIMCFSPSTAPYYPIMESGTKIRKKGTNVGYVGFSGGLDNKQYLDKEYIDFYPNSIITCANPNNDNIHPTQKPIKLIEYLITTHSEKNTLVLDPFSGSGTTAIACHNLGRQFICVEKDPEYHAASVKRLEQAQKNQFLF